MTNRGIAAFGVVDLRQRGLGLLVRRLRERGEDVADLVPPAPLLFPVGEHVAQRPDEGLDANAAMAAAIVTTSRATTRAALPPARPPAIR
jgi:hypothetical protein